MSEINLNLVVQDISFTKDARHGAEDYLVLNFYVETGDANQPKSLYIHGVKGDIVHLHLNATALGSGDFNFQIFFPFTSPFSENFASVNGTLTAPASNQTVFPIMGDTVSSTLNQTGIFKFTMRLTHAATGQVLFVDPQMIVGEDP